METKSNDLEFLFLKHKDKIINELNKGVDIVIKKNRENYVDKNNKRIKKS